MNDKMRNLTVRTLSGIALAAVMLGAIVWSQRSFGLLLALLIVGGMREFYTLARARGLAPQTFIGTIAGLTLFALNFAFVSDDIEIFGEARPLFGGGLAFLLLLVPVMFFCELWRRHEHPLANISVTLAGLFYVALPFSLICYFPILASDAWEPRAMLGYLFIIWANDVFAYLVGMTFGSHRLCERLSPKKSWEGFIGGLIGAMAMGYIAATAMGGDHFEWIGMALIAAITGVFGDLVESLFKRSVDVKDSGRIIPGHGGWLDRFDALILSVPFVFIYLVFCMN